MNRTPGPIPVAPRRENYAGHIVHMNRPHTVRLHDRGDERRGQLGPLIWRNRPAPEIRKPVTAVQAGLRGTPDAIAGIATRRRQSDGHTGDQIATNVDALVFEEADDFGNSLGTSHVTIEYAARASAQCRMPVPMR
jgi:hypothetical protein